MAPRQRKDKALAWLPPRVYQRDGGSFTWYPPAGGSKVIAKKNARPDQAWEAYNAAIADIRPNSLKYFWDQYQESEQWTDHADATRIDYAQSSKIPLKVFAHTDCLIGGIEMQNILMKFDPATGEERPYPSHAAQWREWHGGTAWLFDPWTGRRRDARDVGSDVHGLLIVPAGTLGGDTGCGASKQNKHEAGNDAQWPEPVGWMTPGGDISRSLRWCTERCLPNDFRLEALYTRAQVEAMVCAQRPSTPVGWSDTDWIKHLQEQEGQHPLKWLHINKGSLDAAADAYEAEYNEAQEARRAERDAEKRRAARRNDGRD